MYPVESPLIIIPTYNEYDNIRELVEMIFQKTKEWNVSILVVDSASPDGTAGIVKRLQESNARLYLFEQSKKLGLGRAYLDGMKWAFERQFDCIITMDADFSHHPKYLSSMLELIQNHDLVIGSRYTRHGGVENWPWHRLALSRFANWYARTLTALPFSDLTAGFQCFRRKMLEKVLRYKIHTDGYAFLVELKFLSFLQGAKYSEVPIIFGNRTRGDSKISKRVIFESILFVLSRSLQRRRVKDAIKKVIRSEDNPIKSEIPV